MELKILKFYKLSAFISMILLLLISGMSTAGLVGTASIHAPAVILQNNTGTLTTINLKVTNGNGNVTIIGPISVGNSTLNSSKAAVAYATNYLHINEKKYNFTYEIDDHNVSVSGPSAGMAMTILAIASLTHKTIPKDFTLTGEILPNGTIGEIGGVYDKMSAAKRDGMEFALVPKVSNTSFENKLYYLVQSNFDIPLIQVNNITTAIQYALYNKSIKNEETYYNFYTNYNLSDIPNAPLSCSGDCYNKSFEGLSNSTFSMVHNEILKISKDKNLTNATSQFSSLLNESEEISSKGYYYAGADIAFLDYANVYMFANRNTSISGGFNTLENIKNECGNPVPSKLSNLNYPYFIGGQLRNSWGSYTINSLISTYNQTAVDSDGVMRNMYEAGIANAWCQASNYLFNTSNKIGGKQYMPDSNLSVIASDIISKASAYPSIYTTTAKEAYKSGNYNLAIYDGVYAYTIYGNPGKGLNKSQLLSQAKSLAYNSTYGIWATQFGNEAMFYYYESNSTKNSTQSNLYAQESYDSAILANRLSNYSKIISNNLIPYKPTITTKVISHIGASALITLFTIIILVVLVLSLIMLAIILKLNNEVKELKFEIKKIRSSKTKNTKRYKNNRK